jgi:hypothetical protein
MAALVVATANAVNILDGQDALAGGLVSVAALALATTLSTNRPASWLGLAVAGATLGFLVWNRPPARMFLGNGGAYALGTLLAVVTASLLAARGWEGAVVAGACLSVFSFEVASTMLRRWRLGRSLTGGDRSHSYDVLARRLGSRTASTLVFVGIGRPGRPGRRLRARGARLGPAVVAGGARVSPPPCGVGDLRRRHDGLVGGSFYRGRRCSPVDRGGISPAPPGCRVGRNGVITIRGTDGTAKGLIEWQRSSPCPSPA